MEPDVSNEALMKFELGELAESEIAAIRARLHEPDVATRLAHVRHLLHAMRDGRLDAPSAASVRRLKRIPRPDLFASLARALGQAADTLIATVAYDTRLHPAVAGMRGGASAAHVAYEADSLDAHIRISAEGQQRRMTGQVTRTSGEPCPGAVAIVRLDEPGASIQLISLDDAGMFTIDLEVGRYALAARCGERDLDIGDIEIS